MPYRVLVTGATGFIGFHTACKLAEDPGLEVICIVRHGTDRTKIQAFKARNIAVWRGNFYDTLTLAELFDADPIQCVVHLAAIRGGGRATPLDYERVNVHGTEELLRASLHNKVERFIFCSSVGVHGTIPKNLPVRSDTAYNGDNRYHLSKVRSERIISRYADQGLQACIVRPTITYGANDDGFPTTLVRMVRNRRLVMSKSPVKIHLLYVGSLADVLHALVRRPSFSKGTYILADREPVLLSDLANKIYEHYYGRSYPSYYTFDKSVFKAVELFFKMIKNEKWLARIQLISKSWYYDIGDTLTADIGFNPARTGETFIRYMCNDYR